MVFVYFFNILFRWKSAIIRSFTWVISAVDHPGLRLPPPHNQHPPPPSFLFQRKKSIDTEDMMHEATMLYP